MKPYMDLFDTCVFAFSVRISGNNYTVEYGSKAYAAAIGETITI